MSIRREYKHSSGTLKTILYLIVSPNSVFARFTLTDPTSMTYPSYITDELLTSLGKMVDGESGSHIDEAVHQLKANGMDEIPFSPRFQEFRDTALDIISRLRASVPSSL